MTANSLYRTVGAISLPLATTGESTAQSLVPGHDILLGLLEAALNDELQARWTAVVSGTEQLGLTSPVQSTTPEEPDAALLQTTEHSFPLLAVYRDSERKPVWGDFGLEEESLRSGFAVDYILGPLTVGERRKMLGMLDAALVVIGQTLKRGGHRAYATHTGRTWQPKLVLGPGPDTANFSSVKIAEDSIQRGSASLGGGEPKYWALSLFVETTEIDGFNAEDPTLYDYEGTSITLGTGTIVGDDPDEALAIIDDLVQQNTYVSEEYEMLINIADDTTIDGRSLLIVVTGNTAAVQVTLPADPTFGQLVTVVDGDGQANTYNITISGNGKTISGSATQVISTNYARVSCVYNGVKWSLVT